jgi:hypothetical protein
VTKGGRTAAPVRGLGRASSFLGYAVITMAVWLAWEVLKIPVVERAPPAIALRLAPTSPEALRRAAESELQGGRWDNAKDLADFSLARAPFNARALRTRGLATAKIGNEPLAEQMVTLAGNWSLRDDQAHAWLVEYRLRKGDYGSSFAHADTLARRRPDLYPQLFNLFTVAATMDEKAIPPLVGLLDLDPPWRGAYLRYLWDQADGDALLLTLAVSLQAGDTPLSDQELSRLYRWWAADRRYEAIRLLREQTRRPELAPILRNGDFSLASDKQIAPFGWSFGTASGLAAYIARDDIKADNQALRIEHDGYNATRAARQLQLLPTGRYTLSGRYRQEGESPAAFEWQLNCVEGGPSLFRLRVPSSGTKPTGEWTGFSTSWEVPDGCTAQQLDLMPRPTDRRAPLVMWFDDLVILPVRS